ncbi:S8 family serine peptidase [Deinococcus yavapaiensis]|uniref:Subtilase family protein n=1 Tax=Deinococcus yavapaiensis KR-236 TaxID=694435 RepID=A0A318SCN2_9DEIO|nr:S8 family serine peptidase [Deinococcus yavapaiensis]PYE54568.1 subtilase family protein [Deinococcus yavapaiensis KR-236]
MAKNVLALSAIALTSLLAVGCNSQTGATLPQGSSLQALGTSGVAASYIVSSARALPADFRNTVARNGDQLVSVDEAAGFANVVTKNPSAYGRFADIVVRDLTLQWIPSENDAKFKTVALDETAALTATNPNTNTRYPLLWGLQAVHAPQAWAAGVRGKDATGRKVRVAVLDSGIFKSHPDIAPNLNTELSTSFVSGQTYYDMQGTTFNHGTHVAGTIAAADNNIGVIGVAPDAEIVAVKVLSAKTGSGSFAGIIAGITYAADIDADVINMSLGATLPRRSYIDDNGTPNDTSDDVRVSANEITAITTALSRATTYAYNKGTTIIASEGNDAIDKDKSADIISVPADSAHVLSISATSPEGWGQDPTTNLDVLTSYSNFGASAVNFAAPGGDSRLPGEAPCTVGGLTRPCWVFDMVLSTNVNGGYTWAAGTSMAAPHASGIAALIIGQSGGRMNPAAVASELAKRASDLGKPGNDPAYGGGRVSSGF